MIAALDAWFDRVAGAVHAFGGEVLPKAPSQPRQFALVSALRVEC